MSIASTLKPSLAARRAGTAFEVFLSLLILAGVFFRFTQVNWSQGTNLHPDEYGMTSTLTQLDLPKSLGDYFNTRLSPLSPYAKYDVTGKLLNNGPDNRLRWGQWPLTLLKAAAVITGSTGYNEQRLLGRSLSALADCIALLFIILIGELLYDRRVGLLAGALSALAVLQIQQSHFMTVDNFAVLFTVLAMYAAVRIAKQPAVRRSEPNQDPKGFQKPLGSDLGDSQRQHLPSSPTLLPGPSAGARSARAKGALSYRVDWSALAWYAVFGVYFGMAVASKVNLLPLGGMVGIAALISVADLKLRSQAELKLILFTTAGFVILAIVAGLVTFRVTQPMAFRAASGNTTLLTFNPNPDWVESMAVAQNESDGNGGGPPGEQWAGRAMILFPLMNMVVWGMGLPLGIAAWAGWLGALWQWLRYGSGWRAHLLPLVWVGGDFFFLGTRWVKSVRYFLPLYPFLALLAAWGLLALWRRAQNAAVQPGKRSLLASPVIPGVLIGVVSLGTLAWAVSFTDAVYFTDHTRIQATEWIFQNIPSPFHLSLQSGDGLVYQPVGAPEQLTLLAGQPAFDQTFTPQTSGTLAGLELPHARAAGPGARLHLEIALGPAGSPALAQVDVDVPQAAINSSGGALHIPLQGGLLQAGQSYHLLASLASDSPAVILSRTVVSNESWDEGLPVPFDGYDPFGQFYTGLTMQVRWADNAEKLKMYLEAISQADYIFVPSQRAMWASCRISLTYPMTEEYYRALFDGSLGFDRVAEFQSPLRLGPLYISDLGGNLAWGRDPQLPVLNHNPLAAEEAFSVYDHPPVWIFKKRADFNLAAAQQILGSIDLSKVVVQGPKDATGPICQ
jgi:4-amino-4-deoxy-L-arabinose transferase-like glycosyltransferase